MIPGIYDGIENAVYHATEGLSSSGLSRLAQSPAHYQAYKANPPEQTAAMRMGSAVHAAVLENGLNVGMVLKAPPGTRATKAYKEFAGKQMIRMTEEFQVLSDLYRGGDKRIGTKGRKEILALMAQILCEVPRWKVPAAPTLIKDPAALSRAIQQSPNFFREVLANPKVVMPGNKSIFTSGRQSVKQKEKAKQGITMETKFDAFDAAMEAYLGKQ